MIRDYIILAVSCFIIGVVIALATITVSLRMDIDILGEYVWILAIPAVLAVMVNVTLLELYRKFRKKKP
jgi:fucose 4-O-acetylase-like acetyltransferase